MVVLNIKYPSPDRPAVKGLPDGSRIFVQSTEPVGVVAGDIWIDTSSGTMTIAP